MNIAQIAADNPNRQPQLAAATGTVALVFGSGHSILIAQSHDNGSSFSRLLQSPKRERWLRGNPAASSKFFILRTTNFSGIPLSVEPVILLVRTPSEGGERYGFVLY